MLLLTCPCSAGAAWQCRLVAGGARSQLPEQPNRASLHYCGTKQPKQAHLTTPPFFRVVQLDLHPFTCPLAAGDVPICLWTTHQTIFKGHQGKAVGEASLCLVEAAMDTTLLAGRSPVAHFPFGTCHCNVDIPTARRSVQHHTHMPTHTIPRPLPT